MVSVDDDDVDAGRTPNTSGGRFAEGFVSEYESGLSVLGTGVGVGAAFRPDCEMPTEAKIPKNNEVRTKPFILKARLYRNTMVV